MQASLVDKGTTGGAGRRARVVRRVGLLAVLTVVCFLLAFGWYVSDYYHASQAARSIVDVCDAAPEGVTVKRLESGDVAFVPKDVRCGLSFYPGGKVEAESYAPLLARCAERGFLCVLPRFPANIAMFDPDAAARARSEFPDVEDWVVCGHSLGGIVASTYVAQNEDDVSAIVFLASYPFADLTAYTGGVLSVIGTNDCVVRRDAYDEAQRLLPPDATEVVVVGGNHANFGDYGTQEGDGKATISRERQQERTVDAIDDLVKSCIGD